MHFLRTIALRSIAVCLFGPLAGYGVQQSGPQAETMWDFFNTFAGPDKLLLMEQSFSAGRLDVNGGDECSGSMISPHIFMTAAHCGGPEWTGTVRFFSFSETATAGSTTQGWSAPYAARTFPWQSFPASNDTSNTGDGMLWWLEDGSDGVAPGIKFGFLELSNEGVVQGDLAHSFWVNPVASVNLDSTLLYSSGIALQAPDFTSALGEAETYSVFGAPGGSGSLIIGAAGHHDGAIAVTDQAPSGGGNRTAMNVRHLLAPPAGPDTRQYDADRNGVLDAVENDILFTEAPASFDLLEFNTLLERVQWRQSGIPSGRTTPVGGWSDIRSVAGNWVGRIVGSSGETNDGLWNSALRFAPNSTYRFSVVVYGVSAGAGPGYIKIRSDKGQSDTLLSFQPVIGGWKRFSFRAQLDDLSDYRLIFGQLYGGEYYVQEVSAVREDRGAELGFDTAVERRAWEFLGGCYVTSWGMDPENRFSGVVRWNNPQWGLRNRHIGLRPNHNYTITFDVKHMDGSLSVNDFANVQNLSNVSSASLVWQFKSPGERLHLTMTVSTNNESGDTLSFGNWGSNSYMVDHISIREN